MIPAEDVRLLADLGFIALFRGLDRQASALFEAVLAARPDQDAGAIGSALVALARGEVDGAIKALRALPPSDGAQLFLAVALVRSGDKAEARALLLQVERDAGEPAYRVMARTILDELATETTALPLPLR